MRDRDRTASSSWVARLVLERLLITLLLVVLSSAVSLAGKKNKTESKDPYATAENEAPAPVSPDDLAYRVVVFEQFAVPPEYAQDAKKDVESTRITAMTRLQQTGGFTRVENSGGAAPTDPFILVKGALLDHKIVSGGGRFWGGALAGSSRISYWIRVFNGTDGALLDELHLGSENSAWSAGWTMGGTDRDLPFFVGRVLADYLALRARKDQGTSIAPLWDGGPVPDHAVYTDPATQLTWSVKDNRETVAWERAVAFAKDFRAGGFSDWRLPTEAELATLVNKGKPSELLSETIYASDQVRLSSYLLWTSEEKGEKARVFDFRKGKASFKSKTDYTYMRALAVRK